MSTAEVLSSTRRATELLERFKPLIGIRPAALSLALLRVFGPDQRRSIISATNGLRIYADPFTHLGREILTRGSFESETEEVFRRHLKTDGVFLDIGANEGYFSALAGTLVGPGGFVASIEPQSRLRDIIEINLRINNVSRYRVYTNAFGGEDGAEGQINLWPTHNTGASSIVRHYRFNRRAEKFTFISLDRIFTECKIDHLDLVKVDVEGYEGQVVRYLAPHLRAKRIGLLFLDYHREILDRTGIDRRAIHQEILQCGYNLVSGDATKLESYHLYALSVS
jgi:FkbM family methyltransferase